MKGSKKSHISAKIKHIYQSNMPNGLLNVLVYTEKARGISSNMHFDKQTKKLTITTTLKV